jgi:hypothetical protein
MATFAVIENGKVTNIIVCETKELAEKLTTTTCVEYTDESPAGIGWTYDGTKFIPPVAEVSQNVDTTTTA